MTHAIISLMCLFYIRLQFDYVNNLKFKNTVTVTILRVQVHQC